MKAPFCEDKNANYLTCLQIGMKIYPSLYWYQFSPEPCTKANVFVDENSHKCTVLKCTRSQIEVLLYVTIDSQFEKVHVLLLKESSSLAPGNLLELKYEYSFDYNLQFLKGDLK